MINVKVIEKFALSDKVICIRLASTNNEPLPAASAGSHIDIHLPDNMIRQYSLCSDIGSDYYEIAVLKENNSRGGSIYIHNNLQVLDTVEISEPKNLFSLEASAQNSVLFAAGIGITPILSMSEHLQQHNETFTMHYCSQTADNTAYHDRILNSSLADKCHFHYSKEANSCRLNVADVMPNPDDNTHLYVCGPDGFINEVIKQAELKGWQSCNIHREFFANSALDNTDNGTFEVEIKSSGDVFTIPEDESILNVLEDNGIFIPVACEEGICGTCVVGLLAGEADHRDTFMSEDEKAEMKTITPCCSRAKSKRLVLDV